LGAPDLASETWESATTSKSGTPSVPRLPAARVGEKSSSITKTKPSKPTSPRKKKTGLP
jgi:hypothetical protein